MSFYALCLTTLYMGSDHIYHSVICMIGSALLALLMNILSIRVAYFC